jgi:hypothetical protein
VEARSAWRVGQAGRADSSCPVHAFEGQVQPRKRLAELSHGHRRRGEANHLRQLLHSACTGVERALRDYGQVPSQRAGVLGVRATGRMARRREAAGAPASGPKPYGAQARLASGAPVSRGPAAACTRRCSWLRAGCWLPEGLSRRRSTSAR